MRRIHAAILLALVLLSTGGAVIQAVLQEVGGEPRPEPPPPAASSPPVFLPGRTAGGTIRGRVFDTNGQGVAAGLEVVPEWLRTPQPWVVGTRDDGSFVLTGFPAGRYVVAATTQHSVGSCSVRIPSEATDATVEIHLVELASVEVAVSPPSWGRLRVVGMGIKETLPWLHISRYMTEVGVVRYGERTNLHWWFPGRTVIGFIGADRWGSAEVDLQPGENRVVIRTARMGSIWGQVTGPDGAGIPAWVRLVPTNASLEAYPESNQDVPSESGGHFTYPQVPPGRWRIRALPLDPAYGPAEVDVEVTPGQGDRVTIGVGCGRRVRLQAQESVESLAICAFGAAGARVQLADPLTGEVTGLPDSQAGVVVAWNGTLERPSVRGPVGRADIGPAAVQTTLEIGEPAVLMGMVVNASGAPAGAGVVVRVVPDYVEMPGANERNPFWTNPATGSILRPLTEGPLGVRLCSTDAEGRFGPIFLVPGRVRVEIPGGDATTVRLGFEDRQQVTLRLP